MVALAERVGELVDGLEINVATLAKTHFQHVQRALRGELLGGYRADHVERVARGTGRGRGRRRGRGGRERWHELGNEGIDGCIETQIVHVG